MQQTVHIKKANSYLINWLKILFSARSEIDEFYKSEYF